MTNWPTLLLALVVSNAAFTIQLRLSPQTIGSGPEVLGDNAPHFTQGSNTADWWRYSRINVARVWSPPGIVEDVGDALRSLRRARKRMVKTVARSCCSHPQRGQATTTATASSIWRTTPCGETTMSRLAASMPYRNRNRYCQCCSCFSAVGWGGESNDELPRLW